MALSPEELAVVASLGGAVVGALPGLVSSFLTKRSDERKQFKELVVKAAIESWKTHAAHAGTRAMLPLEHYIIYTAKMCEFALADKKVTAESMRTHLQEVSALMEVLVQHAKAPGRKPAASPSTRADS
jgi:lipase chaperone LimK